MNAHTTIRVDETVTERAHRHSISIHCPNCNEMEMAARVDLAQLRDAAMVGMNRASDNAVPLLHQVSILAAQAVYAQTSTSHLLRVRAALNLTMEAARAIERALRNG